MRIEINKERIDYLLALYRMPEEDLLSLLNKDRKKKVGPNALRGNHIDLPLLKRIDAIFQKGLNFYTDFFPIRQDAASSVFFRKERFSANLNLEAKRIVDKFETLKTTLNGYLKLARVSPRERRYTYTLSDSPKDAAQESRSQFHPGAISNSRQFLKEFINKCAQQDIYVFEFIETWNKKERANIDGFFLMPDTIVLKRQKSYKREIFTLAHELGHCLLGKEEVDSLDMADLSQTMLNDTTEKWCNDFAYYFIMGEYAEKINEIWQADKSNDCFHELVQQVSNNTNISRLAIYTHLFLEKKVSYPDYAAIKRDLFKQYEARMTKAKEKNKGKNGGGIPKPIVSPLYIEALQYAFFKGVINEYTFCSSLNITSSKMQDYL